MRQTTIRKVKKVDKHKREQKKNAPNKRGNNKKENKHDHRTIKQDKTNDSSATVERLWKVFLQNE